MTNSSKRKGDRAELEVQALLQDQLGVPARRALGAGRRDDVGDIDGVPQLAVQVCAWRDIARAVREKPLDAEIQRVRKCVPYTATFVRLRGGDYRVVLTPDQFFTLYREATA